jgi:hypothetical protein
MSDPAGAAAKAGSPPPSMLEVLKFLRSKPSVPHLLAGCALAAISMNGIGQFFGQYLTRNFHLGFAETGRVMSIVAGAAMPCGMLLGGFGIDWAARYDKRWYAWGPSLTLVLACPFLVLGFAQPTLLGAALVLAIAHVLLFVYWTPTLALGANMVSASMRASSVFVFNFILGMVGIGLGPTLVGFISEAYARHSFTAGDYALCPQGRAPAAIVDAFTQACVDSKAIGLRHALMTISLSCIWAGVHYWLASRTIRKDLETFYTPR